MTADPWKEPSNELRHRGNIQDIVKVKSRPFDIKLLPEDLQRVYGILKKDYGEQYALLFCFNMRTAVELHRAWHMTLLTSKILQKVKDKFKLRMTWSLGVVQLKFRCEDGGHELHRKVPFDYDSEYQDLYLKISEALVAGHIDVHQALWFQVETIEGKHTARSGRFLRQFPGRLILYPFEAATCAIIFFSGDWDDCGVAALTGLAAGLVDYSLGFFRPEAKVLLDVLVGVSTGVIASLFYRYDGQRVCLSSIFMATLYWFFYGTAFVLGFLEIIAGELQTGVTRFIAVSIKTFTLSLGAAFGMMIVLENTTDAWIEQEKNCGLIDLDEKWWRILMYIACSISVLGQYQAPIVHYWRGTMVMVAAYEVQYQTQKWAAERHERDNLDTALSNVLGAAAGVIVACALARFVDWLRRHYFYARLLQRDQGEQLNMCGRFMFWVMSCAVQACNCCYIGRKTDLTKLQIERKLKTQIAELEDKNHPRSAIDLDEKEEAVLVEAIVSSQKMNIWAILMPAVYQLVPGSIIAKLWFNSIFPPPMIETQMPIAGTNLTYTAFTNDETKGNIFANLLVISTSLSLGLAFGFAAVQIFEKILHCFGGAQNDSVDGMYFKPNYDPTTPRETVQTSDDSEMVEII